MKTFNHVFELFDSRAKRKQSGHQHAIVLSCPESLEKHIELIPMLGEKVKATIKREVKNEGPGAINPEITINCELYSVNRKRSSEMELLNVTLIGPYDKAVAIQAEQLLFDNVIVTLTEDQSDLPGINEAEDINIDIDEEV